MTTHNYAGWIPSPPDDRDHIYTVSSLLQVPDETDLRQYYSTPIWQQGSIGSCGPQSAARDLLFDQEQTPAPDTVPSRLFIYWNARRLMGTLDRDSGVDNRSLCKAVEKYGWCSEQSWPYIPSRYRNEPPQECFEDAAKRTGKCHYERVVATMLKGALAQKDPVICGFAVYENIEEAARDGVIRMPRGRRVGGHDVLLMGYSNSRGAFLFANSWGLRWGDKGYGWLPYEYALSLELAGDFWTLHYDDGDVPAPPQPAPVPKAMTVQVPSDVRAVVLEIQR